MRLKDVLTGSPIDFFLWLIVFFFFVSSVMLFINF